MIVYPNCKINIGLRVLNKRSDNFHNIESIFYPVNWCDILELIIDSKGGENKIKMSVSGISIPDDVNENLCVKAYHLINQDYALPALKIHLHKQIPIGAGLGGGSSDAAFFIKALNEISQINLAFGEMHHYAKQLGSDCSFFINNKPALALQKGDELESVNLNLSNYFIVIIYPNFHISTQEAYSKIKPELHNNSLEDLINEPIENWKSIIENDFEKTLILSYTAIAEIKNKLYNEGAFYAAMSGSGSAVYGIFKNATSLKKVFEPYVVYEGKLN